jgi:hypothetical protein
MNQGMEIAAWLGIGGLVLIWGPVHLWHTRRVLKRLREEVAVTASRVSPNTVGEQVSSGMAS